LQGTSLLSRSACPFCQQNLSPHHLIPLISWITLRGKCAYCHARISGWYPALELITAVWLYAAWLFIPARFLPLVFFNGSALIVTLRTDGEHFLILSCMTLYLVPLNIIASLLQLTALTPFESISGACIGGGLLILLRTAFYLMKGVEGLGWGDVELLALIGSCTGPWGVWMSLLLGSLSGLLYACMVYILCPQNGFRALKVPFGLFLSAAALVALMVPDYLRLISCMV
jgi:leader peptidase (prepilin peptidase)/N-methyltransferase